MEKIRFENLSFSYPLSEYLALDNISLEVNPSEFIVICGRSGCGKSTLLRHFKKSLTPYGVQKGKVLYGDVDIKNLNDKVAAEKIGFVQQDPDNQIVTDKVWHELAFGLENMGIPNQLMKLRVAEMASYLGIQDWYHRDVSTLSGGQKQLLNLASILVMQPEILVLDEPVSQLDPIAASDFIQTLYKINRDLGITVVISEHRLEDIFPIADKVIVMDEGKIIFSGPPKRVGYLLMKRSNMGDIVHPMFYAIPSVMRIFQPFCDYDEDIPITIREGRLKLQGIVSNNKAVSEINPKIIKKENRKSSDSNDKTDEIIKVDNVWFRYSQDSDFVLRGLDFNAKRGEIHCMLGGNGSGKSTTLKAICGIVKPQRGTIRVEDKIISKKNEKGIFNEFLAMVPQNPQAIFTEITCEEELYESVSESRIDDALKIKRVEDILKMMELSHLRKANPYDLSGGEQQRLAIGKILLLNPKILLLDEPTKGLDPFFKIKLAEILNSLKRQGVTIFMVSHDIEFCASYADRCYMFFDGEIVSSGAPNDFFAGNNFYTTVANRITREVGNNFITVDDVVNYIGTFNHEK